MSFDTYPRHFLLLTHISPLWRIYGSAHDNAEAASTLHHPNIVQVYDYGHTEDKSYMVMELVDGINLRQYLRTKSNVLSVQHAISIASAIANGLAAIHQQHLIYRALKTNKVLIEYDGSAKLTSFDLVTLCRDILDGLATTVGRPLGVVHYSTPEQARGKNVSPASDVYASGIILYEMLTGYPPFDGDTPVAVAMQHIHDAPTPPGHLNPDIPFSKT